MIRNDRGAEVPPRAVVSLLVTVLVLLSMPAASAPARDPLDDFDSSPDAWDLGPTVAVPDFLTPQGPGLQFRTGHLAFPTFGRTSSISHVELFPYLLADDEMLFGDMRMFLSNHGRLGGNLGLGYRYRIRGWDRILGASLWYDLDETTGRTFQQVGVSLETYGTFWDLRSNLYFPIVDREKDYHLLPFNPQFTGNGILFDAARTFGRALPGADLELGLPVPFDFARRHRLRVFGGGYHFAGSGVPDITGVKGRVEADLFAGLGTQVEFTRDDTFGTNVMLGVSWTWAGRFRRDDSGPAPRFDRMGEFVQRNHNVIVSRQTETTFGNVAINPLTGQAYIVQHVSGSGNSDGSVENPYQTIADARAAGGDFIFVHADTVFTEPLVLQEGDRLLGEGGNHTLALAGFGNVLLPRATAGASRPVIELANPGNAVTLASNTVFSGFIINSPDGHGIVGHNLTNAVVGHVDINNATGSGVLLQDTAGSVTFTRTQINNAGGPALHVDGGAGNIGFQGVIDNSADRALLVENTTGGTADLGGLTITDDGGQGILIDNADGNVVVGKATVGNSATTGIHVTGGAGHVTFNHATVTDADDVGVHIENRTGRTTFGTLNISSDSHTALLVEDSGKVSTGGGTIAAANATAIDLQNTEMNINLTSVSSSGADFGLRLVNAPGTFSVFGGSATGSGGTITGATNAGVFLNNVGKVGLRRVNLTDNRIGIDAAAVDHLIVTESRITGSDEFGIRSLNAKTLEVSYSIFENNGALGQNSIFAEVNQGGSRVYSLVGNVITGHTSSAVVIAGPQNSSLNLLVVGNQIVTHGNGHSGIDIDWQGGLIGTITDNEIGGHGDQSTGINLSSGTPMAQIAVADNHFAFGGVQSTGVNIVTGGASQIAIGGNLIEFVGANATDGVGLRFDLAQSAQAHLWGNAIIDNAGGGTGVLFHSMAGPSQVRIEGNEIYMLSTGPAIDRGIIFSSITGTVELFGNQTNLVHATTLFSAPVGKTTGEIYINGNKAPW